MEDINTRRRQFMKSSAGVLGAASLSGCVSNLGSGGGEYPTKDIKVIINVAAGGSTDAYARQIAASAIEELGVNAEMQNITGAGGLRGIGRVANAQPNGYTMGTIAPPSSPVSYLLNKPDWEMTDLVPVGGYSIGVYGIWTRPNADVNNFDEFLRKYQSGEWKNIGTQDSGGVTTVIAHFMKNSDEFDFSWKEQIGYPGSAPAAKALISEEVPAVLASSGGVRNYYRQDQLKCIAMMHSGGSPLFPDLPVLPESYPNIDFLSRFVRGLILPPETSNDIQTTLWESIESEAKSEETKQWVEESGNPVNLVPTKEFGNSIEQALTQIPEKVDLEKIRQ